ncbi:unnamed protein product, partial [Polarella glacialis]
MTARTILSSIGSVALLLVAWAVAAPGGLILVGKTRGAYFDLQLLLLLSLSLLLLLLLMLLLLLLLLVLFWLLVLLFCSWQQASWSETTSCCHGWLSPSAETSELACTGPPAARMLPAAFRSLLAGLPIRG